MEADSATVSGFRTFKRIPLTFCGFRLQFAESAYSLRFRLQFADSTYSCGLCNSLILQNTFSIISHILLRIPQICAVFRAILSNTAEKIKKIAFSRIPGRIRILLVVEFAYNSQNAQFGLVMKL